MKTATMLISCPDARGITAKVTGFVFEHGGNILHADQHMDDSTNTFFMRVEWSADASIMRRDIIQRDFAFIAEKYQMNWQLYFSEEKPKVAIYVSKYLHCLYDIMWKYKSGYFNCEIACIISNHTDAKSLADNFSIPYYQIEVTAENKAKAEAMQFEIMQRHEIELVLLARYMQVLSGDFVNKYKNSIINIHHSFLPAFKGANPYKQAFEKGVKIIGATAHYVCEELDTGPIIEQDTTKISHRDEIEDLVRKGQDLEKIVFCRAIELHLKRKILTYNNKTVVFD